MRLPSSSRGPIAVALAAVFALSACAPQSANDETVSAQSRRRSSTTTTAKTTTTTAAVGRVTPTTAKVVAPTTTAASGAPVSSDPRTPTVPVQQLIDDTHLMHENGHYPYTAQYWGSYGGPSFSYVATHEYTQKPGPTDWVSNYSGGLAGMHPWYELTTEEGSPTNLNAVVEMSRIGLAVHRKSTNRWDVIYNSTGSYIPQAWSWANASGYLPDVKNTTGDRRMGLGLGQFGDSVYESSLGGNGRLRAHGWSDAGWDNGRNYFRNDPSVAADVDAVEAWVTARVAKRDAGGPDDVARSQYRLMPGFDIMKLGTDVPSPPPGAWAGMQGRARVVTGNWQTFTVSTMSDAMVNSLPSPPVPGFTRSTVAPGGSTGSVTTGTTPAAPSAGATTIDDDASGVAYSGGWTLDSGASNYLATQHYTNVAGESATVSVSGTSIEVFGGKAHDMGQLTVSVDGGAPVTLDAYSASTQFNVSLGRISGLSAGAHTVRIVASSARNGAADGNYVSIDRLVVS